ASALAHFPPFFRIVQQIAQRIAKRFVTRNRAPSAKLKVLMQNAAIGMSDYRCAFVPGFECDERERFIGRKLDQGGSPGQQIGFGWLRNEAQIAPNRTIRDLQVAAADENKCELIGTLGLVLLEPIDQ